MSYNADDCPDSETVGAGGGGGSGSGTSELNCTTPSSPGMTRQDAVVLHGDGGSIDDGGGGVGGDVIPGAPPTAVGSSGYEPCDPLIILNLFQSLSATTNSLELQMKINLHLKALTRSPYVFLVPILHSSEEGLIQVINDNVLDKEIRFSLFVFIPRLKSSRGGW
uniref:Uncharacterized protein n=1 Tax=Anopheles dirus TaxID=7168 RepID=A0A182NTS1_9DIPT